MEHNALVVHMMSVAACFSVLLEEPHLLSRFQSLFRRTLTDFDKVILAWFAALHDMGKVARAFQMLRPDVAQELTGRTGARTPQGSFHHGDHGFFLLHESIPEILESKEVQEVLLLKGLLNACCGHHNRYVGLTRLKLTEDEKKDRSVADQLARDLLTALVAAFPQCKRTPGWPMLAPSSRHRWMSLLHLLAGTVSLADWIGSDEKVFPYLSCSELERDYPGTKGLSRLFLSCRRKAKDRLDELELFRRPIPSSTLRSALDVLLDSKGHAARPLQRWIIDDFKPVPGPNLLLIEAPMGEGKTEAALLAAAAAIDANLAQGIVFALPTQASANQNHSRVAAIARAWFNYVPALIHGKASALGRVRDILEGHRKQVSDSPENEAALHFSEWVGERGKKVFLHPMCTSTVDQIELAVINCKHFFVRAAALARHCVIIDEIHSYDAYMSTILDSLLEFLGAVEAPVVLLSATLPSSIRERMVRAYARGSAVRVDSEDLKTDHYPIATRLDGGGVTVAPIASEGGIAGLKILLFSAEEEGEKEAIFRAREGACVGVICNSRKSARARYRKIKRECGGEVLVELFHAGMRTADRDRRGERIEGCFGKGSTLKDRARRILVATQVVEQSLDLDFDWIVSEIAPIDLLLQRAGRLHRHREHDPLRPHGCKEACLGVILGDPSSRWYRATHHVYAEGQAILQRTRNWLEDHPYVNYPRGISQAVGEVYGMEAIKSSQAARRTHKAGGLVLKHENVNFAFPMSHQEEARESDTRDAPESMRFLLVVRDSEDECDRIPVWSEESKSWDVLDLPAYLRPDGMPNPEFFKQAGLWDLSFEKASENHHALQDDILDDGTSPKGITKVSCTIDGATLKMGSRACYSIEEGFFLEDEED